MKKIFVCCGYYHLLISMIKSMKTNDECDLLITTAWNDFTLLDDSNLIDRLNKSNIFSNIILDNYLIKERKQIINSKFKQIKEIFILKKMKKDSIVNFLGYDEIYIFSYNIPVGRLITKNKIFHILLEDGTNCYKNNKILIKKKLTLKNFIKKFILNFKEYGESKYIKYIEVNDKNGICIDNQNIVEEPKIKMFNNLTNAEKKEIIYIFLGKQNFEKLNNTNLLLTQPFCQDGILKDENEQIRMYNEIIKNECSNQIIIKMHPREKIN